MQKLMTVLFLGCTLSCYSQSDYDLFESYNSVFLRNQNSNIKSVTGLKESKSKLRKIISYKEFSSTGLPRKIIEYDENSTELKTIEFIYTKFEKPSSINTFQKGKRFSTSEFFYDSTHVLKYFKDYVYSSLDGEKMLLWETSFKYYNNKKLKTIIKMEVSDVLPKRDTAEIVYFDSTGEKTKSYFDMAGYKQFISYEWNQDKTIMKECVYNSDTIQNTIIHKYKGGNEIEQLEKDSNKPLIFWKYDKKNRLLQTNSALFVTQDLLYNSIGYLVKESWTATFPELVKDNDSKIMRFRYEYKFRK